MTTLLTGSRLDDFLADAGRRSTPATGANASARPVRCWGSSWLSGCCCSSRAHRGPQPEIGTLLRIVGAASFITIVGAAVEVVGAAESLEVGWSEALTSSPRSDAMMRLLAGLLIVLGLAAGG